MLTPDFISVTLQGQPSRVPEQPIAGVSIDTRTLQPGDLFVALAGPNHNGHAYVEQAFEKGASAALVQEPVTSDGPVWRVSQTEQALRDLAVAHRQQFSLPVVALTGSVGKTTTKEMLAHILGADRKVLATQGTQNNHLGVPLTLLRLNDSHAVAVIELGTNHFGEIQQLTQWVQPTIGMILNIGHAHLEFFGDLAGVARAKWELVEALSPEATVVLSADDPYLIKCAKGITQEVVWFKKIDLATLPLSLTIPGEHQRINAVAAIRVARLLGVDEATACERLKTFAPVEGRLSVLEKEGVTYLHDAYNANPTSLEAALTVLDQAQPEGQKVAILADMLELGAQSQTLHEQVGVTIAQTDINQLILVGEEVLHLKAGALRAGFASSDLMHVADVAQAKQQLTQTLKPGDMVLIKGSRQFHLEQVL